jgi:hypothetical protein
VRRSSTVRHFVVNSISNISRLCLRLTLPLFRYALTCSVSYLICVWDLLIALSLIWLAVVLCYSNSWVSLARRCTLSVACWCEFCRRERCKTGHGSFFCGPSVVWRLLAHFLLTSDKYVRETPLHYCNNGLIDG